MHSSVSGWWLTAGAGTIWAHMGCGDDGAEITRQVLWSQQLLIFITMHLHGGFAQGNADAAGRASSASAQSDRMSERVCARRNTNRLSLPEQPGSGGEILRVFLMGRADKTVVFQRVAQGGNLQREVFTGGWMEFGCTSETYSCNICSFSAERSQSVAVQILRQPRSLNKVLWYPKGSEEQAICYCGTKTGWFPRCSWAVWAASLKYLVTYCFKSVVTFVGIRAPSGLRVCRL